jgi:hypothetical protein
LGVQVQMDKIASRHDYNLKFKRQRAKLKFKT